MEQDILLQICFSDAVEAGPIPYLPVKQIPSSIFDLLGDIGEIQTLGAFQIVTIKDSQYYGTVTRMVQFIGSKEYEPFITGRSTTMGVARGEEKPVLFDYTKHPHDTTYTATEKAHGYFVEEAKLYACSVANEWTALQDYSSKKIRYNYPVYAAEIVVLLQELAPQSGSIIDFGDEKMKEFVGRRISTCQAGLIINDSFLNLISRMVHPKLQLDILVACSAANGFQDVITALRSGIDTETWANALLENFLASTLVTPRAVATLPTRPGVISEAVSGKANIAFEALRQHRWLVAPYDGWGTLRFTSEGQAHNAAHNQDFHFGKGEILLVTDPGFGGTNTAQKKLAVQNDKGEVGEVVVGLGFRSVQDFIRRSNSAHAEVKHPKERPARHDSYRPPSSSAMSAQQESQSKKRKGLGESSFSQKFSRRDS